MQIIHSIVDCKLKNAGNAGKKIVIDDGVFVADVNYIYKSVFDRLPKRAREILRNSGFEIKPDPIKIE